MNRLALYTGLSLSLLTLAASNSAAAEELGSRGNFVFGVERLFGFYIDKQSVDRGPFNVDVDTTDFSLGWNSPPSGLTIPRLAFDYVIDDHFTLGGNFGVYTRNASTSGGGATGASADDTGISFGLRGGYLLRLGHAVSFWPRGGFSYSTVSGNGLAPDSHLIALNLEGMFTLAPTEGWAFLLGPTIDIGLSGKVAGNSLSEQCFGIMAGLIGWFGA